MNPFTWLWRWNERRRHERPQGPSTFMLDAVFVARKAWTAYVAPVACAAVALAAAAFAPPEAQPGASIAAAGVLSAALYWALSLASFRLWCDHDGIWTSRRWWPGVDRCTGLLWMDSGRAHWQARRWLGVLLADRLVLCDCWSKEKVLQVTHMADAHRLAALINAERQQRVGSGGATWRPQMAAALRGPLVSKQPV